MTTKRRRDGEVVFECDSCGNEHETGERSFSDAVEVARDNGVQSRKDEDDAWVHFCDDECRRNFMTGRKK